MSLLLTLNRFHTHCSGVSIVDFEQVNAGLEVIFIFTYNIQYTNSNSVNSHHHKSYGKFFLKLYE